MVRPKTARHCRRGYVCLPALLISIVAALPCAGATATFRMLDSGTQGNWSGVYGADGWNVIGAGASYPTYGVVAPSGNSSYTWASSTTDVRALQNPAASGRVAATWYSSGSFAIDINLTDNNPHTLALYLVDWDFAGRAESVALSDASTHAVLDSRSVSSFTGGVYLVWTVSGHVSAVITRTAGSNAVVSGIFFGPPPVTSSAAFARTDTTTQGAWGKAYGADGYDVLGDSQALPSYLPAISPSGNGTYVWAASTTDPRALQKGSGTGQIAACWFANSSFTIDLNLGSTPHLMAAYLLDWDNGGRSERVDMLDAGTGTVLDSRTVSGFTSGDYLVWTVVGHLTMRITTLSGGNAVLSGLFFGGQPLTSTPSPSSASSSAGFLGTDTSTQGNWNVPYGTGQGPFGTDGYLIANDSSKLPTYGSASVNGASLYTWVLSTGDGRSLITGAGNSRIASAWYAASGFMVDINLADANTHQVALYLLDWDSSGRAESIQVTDAVTGTTLDSRSMSSFRGGIYLIWTIKGHVTISLSRSQGSNAVLSGIFFGTGTLNRPAANPTQIENAQPGTSSWQLTNPAAAREIEGYASRTSANAGDTINFFVNTADPTYTLQIYRMGWYGGTGSRQVLGPVTLTGIRQPIPTPDPSTGLLECAWTNPYSVTIPAANVWPSGVFLVKLTGTTSGKQSYIIFVVRDDQRASRYLFQTAVTTYQAYNNWGGKSLYSFNSTGQLQGYKVSFNRPYALGAQSQSMWGVGAGHFLTNAQPADWTPAEGWEYNMVRFLEREGYDVAYCTDIDAHENGALLLNHHALLVVGHSEYWSWQMRTNFEGARDSGVGLAFFAANDCYWQVRLNPSNVDGAADRIMVGYKEQAFNLDPFATDSDPTNDRYITTYWRKNPVKPPEDALAGVMYVTDPVAADIVIQSSTNPVYALTGLNNGNALQNLLGYEVDEAFGDAPPNQVLLSATPLSSTFWTPPARGGQANMSIYSAPSGAMVFATGSIWWSWGLDDDYFSPALRTSRLNVIAQQITRNVLAKF